MALLCLSKLYAGIYSKAGIYVAMGYDSKSKERI